MEHTTSRDDTLRDDIDKLMYVLNVTSEERGSVLRQKKNIVFFLLVTIICGFLSFSFTPKGYIIYTISISLSIIGMILLYSLYHRYDKEVEKFVQIYKSPKDTSIELIKIEGMQNIIKKSRGYLWTYCAIRGLNAASFLMMSASIFYAFIQIIN